MGYFRQAVKGTGWMTALRGITRGFGFIKIAILARILTPEDFGIFGIAALTIALLETFTEPGVSLALIQQDEDIDEYVDTAWLISITRGILIGILMASFSGIIAFFFNRPDASGLILVAALIPFIRGFLNPAAVNFVKKLEFNKEFLLRSLPMTVDIGSSITFALLLRSPIAIIYGMLIGSLVEVALTFIIPKIRPSFRFVKSHARKLISFGKWVTVGWIMSYLAENFDDILVGRILGASSLGIYQMAYKMSVLPSVELSEVISKVIFPVYSKIAGDRERLKKAVLKTTAVLIAISVPIVLVIILFPKPIIRVVLGDQWLAAAVPLRILAVFGFTRAISQGPSAALYAAGRPDIAAKIRALRFFTMAILLFMIMPQYGLIGVSIAVVSSAFLTQPFLWLSLVKVLRTKSSL
jgi:O-antigen/teichoic acid export membrane protein